MEPRIYSLGGSIHCAFGYSVVNCTLIEGEESCILVDTMTGMDNAGVVAAEFRKITDKPIRTIVYTHFHADHVSGAAAFVSADDVASGRVEIVAQQDLVSHVMRDVGPIAPILGRRAMYQFGMRLPIGESGTVGAGLGPPQRPGPRSFFPPTVTFEDSYSGETGGVAFEIHLIPSETEDQCAVWLPDRRVLLSADAVYESFPNVYALRGTRFRDPMAWARGLDRLKAFGAETLVPHHGRPVEGAERIAALLTDYRDAVQYVHDRTLRYMNKGYAPDEVAALVAMPERLRNHPWLGEYYGSYKHSIPAIYAGYLGWYQGDPVALDLAAGGMVLGTPEQVRGFPLSAIMNVMTVRLMAEECRETHLRVAFETTDSGESCALEIRRGVCQFYETPPPERDATARFDRGFLLDWVFGRTAFEDAVAAKRVSVDGDAAVVAEFLAKFEPFNQQDEMAIAAR